MKLDLKPLDPRDVPLSLEWDPDAGTLTGEGADVARRLLDEAAEAGYAPAHPEPRDYPVSDPYRAADQLAVCLGQWWRLPPELADAYPALPEEQPSDVELIH